MLKAVLYYPKIKDLLNFSEEKFNLLSELFPLINFIYTEELSHFQDAILDAEYIFASQLTNEQYQSAKHLQAIFCYAAGKEGICSTALNNVRCYFGNFHGKLMAESLLAAILFFNQQLPQALALQKEKRWQQTAFAKRRTLLGQKIALVGYGSIGRYCAKLLNTLGMQIYAVQRSFKGGQCEISGAQYVHAKELNSLLPELDHIVSLLPYSEDTINYFDADFFAKLSPQAFFYNLGRGHSVNEHDIIVALKNKTIAGAMLDVFASEPLAATSSLWDIENLLITPHISAFYQNYVDLYLNDLIEQINAELQIVTRD